MITKGSLIQYDFARADSLRSARVPHRFPVQAVFVPAIRFRWYGQMEFVICEYGRQPGRLALISTTVRGLHGMVLDPSPVRSGSRSAT